MILAAFTRTACNPLTCRKCYNFLLRSFVTLYRPTIFHRFPLSVPRFASVTRPPMYLNEIDDSSPSLFPLFSLCRCRFLHFFLFFSPFFFSSLFLLIFLFFFSYTATYFSVGPLFLFFPPYFNSQSPFHLFLCPCSLFFYFAFFLSFTRLRFLCLSF